MRTSSLRVLRQSFRSALSALDLLAAGASAALPQGTSARRIQASRLRALPGPDHVQEPLSVRAESPGRVLEGPRSQRSGPGTAPWIRQSEMWGWNSPVDNGSWYRECPDQLRITVCLTESPMFITSGIVRAHSLCPRKAFLLLYPDTSQSTDRSHAYVQVLEQRAKVNQARHVAEIRRRSGNPCPSDGNLLSTGPDFLVNVSIRSGDLEADCDVLTK